tara:strand:- start:284 stop:517 length:234 start_codon:yes stop_codon:yes gene_type:complete
MKDFEFGHKWPTPNVIRLFIHDAVKKYNETHEKLLPPNIGHILDLAISRACDEWKIKGYDAGIDLLQSHLGVSEEDK